MKQAKSESKSDLCHVHRFQNIEKGVQILREKSKGGVNIDRQAQIFTELPIFQKFTCHVLKFRKDTMSYNTQEP